MLLNYPMVPGFRDVEKALYRNWHSYCDETKAIAAYWKGQSVYPIVYPKRKLPKIKGYGIFRNPLFLFGRGEKI